ncbi:dehydrogenase [Lithospermum erythrorhizon]|uniref:CASP-like protein n=1 Tax=Lithospermum erythrorhizon TaxID=34254 RepID=A0AAV3NK98_LITER
MSEIDEKQPVLQHEAKATTTMATTMALEPPKYVGLGDVVLRLLLFASALVAVLVMIIDSNQTETVELTLPPFINPITFVRTAKIKHWPAFIYFVTTLSLAGLYSIITLALSSSILFFKLKITCMLLPYLIMMDVVINVGIVSSATGAAGAVAYTALKGNSHTNWTNICDTYDHFCQHIGISVMVSLFASILLVMLLLLNINTLFKKINK